MRNKFAGTACAALLVMGVSGTADANSIATMEFTNSASGYVSYEFDIQAMTFNEGGTVFVEYTLDFLSADINGSVYNSSNAILQMGGFEVTTLTVWDVNNETVISSLTFGGYFGAPSGTLDMLYSGATYAGASYSFDSVGGPMLYDQMGGLEMTSVAVNTVSAVPVPAAVWLFGSGLIGLAGMARRKA